MLKNHYSNLFWFVFTMLCLLIVLLTGCSSVENEPVPFSSPSSLSENTIPEFVDSDHDDVSYFEEDQEQSIYNIYDITPFDEYSEDNSKITSLQAYKRLNEIDFDPQIISYPKQSHEKLSSVINAQLDHIPTLEDFDEESIFEFDGETTSELNQLISDNAPCYIKVTSEELECDEPIVGLSDVVLEGDNTSILFNGIPRAFDIQEANHWSLSGFRIESTDFDYGIYVENAKFFSISSIRVSHALRAGISIQRDSGQFKIEECELYACHSGISINGNVCNGVVTKNRICYSSEPSNHYAGIFLGGAPLGEIGSGDLVFSDLEIDQLSTAVHSVMVTNNELVGNRAQGIYTYAAYNCFILDNKITANRKEGICLDFGTCGCFVYGNEIKMNGERQQVGDGYSESDKLPGLSFDNACYNIVCRNDISYNSGSGVKAVRSSFRNIVAENNIEHNNQGTANDSGVYFGVEWATDLRPDFPGAQGLDFTACYENATVKNNINGAHYVGIFLGEDAEDNLVGENDVNGARIRSFENHSYQPNEFRNNIADGEEDSGDHDVYELYALKNEE